MKHSFLTTVSAIALSLSLTSATIAADLPESGSYKPPVTHNNILPKHVVRHKLHRLPYSDETVTNVPVQEQTIQEQVTVPNYQTPIPNGVIYVRPPIYSALTRFDVPFFGARPLIRPVYRFRYALPQIGTLGAYYRPAVPIRFGVPCRSHLPQVQPQVQPQQPQNAPIK